MAELTPKERLQPSLLDRLTDNEPDRQTESRDLRVLSPQRLRESYLHQTTLLAERFDELELDDVTRDRETPLELFGGFLAVESERAEELSRRLLEAGVVTDSRRRYLRFGPAPYLSDEQLEAAIEQLGRVAGP